jgi:AcrR family transcriptional regulator
MFSSPLDPLSKSERTRARIRAAALRSFRDEGYDATTIRRIAEAAGVSVGTTNYHFASKNHLVQELYLDVQSAHRDAAEPLLASAGRDLSTRVGIVLRTGLDQLEPYHRHAPEFLAAAMSPRSALNPLAPESAPALAVVEGLFRTAVEGAAGVPAGLRAALPRALVLAYLLLALFWVYDRSTGRTRTRGVLAAGLALFGAALPFARTPVLGRPVRRLLALLGDVRA